MTKRPTIARGGRVRVSAVLLTAVAVATLSAVAPSSAVGGAVTPRPGTAAGDPPAYTTKVNQLVARVNDTPGTAKAEPNQDASWGTATGANFPKLGGNLGNDDYSSLTQLTPANVASLGGAWRTALETDRAAPTQQEATPVVTAGRMFVPTTQQDLYAVNAATGSVLWRYRSGFAPDLPSSRRGATVGDGLVFATFGGEHVAALDQATGKLKWLVRLGTGKYGLPAAMVFYNHLLFIGTSNGGQSGGRGTVYELDAATGAVKWSYNSTVTSTWPSAGAAAVGGADAWMHPAIDPTHGLVYWTLGDPEKRNDGAARAGKNLYSCSIIALDIATGTLRWSFQSVHHDIWDYDNVMAPVLANIHVNGTQQPAVIYGSKTGMMFELNRLTGKPLLPVSEVAVPQDAQQHTSPTQPFPSGQAYVPVCPRDGTNEPVPNFATGCIFTPHESDPVLVAPATAGGANWGADSFDPKTGLVYLGATLANTTESDGTQVPDMFRPAGERIAGRLVALDPRTNTMAWFVDTPYPAAGGQGIVTTAGGLLLQGQIDGQLVVRSVADGSQLWSISTGAAITSTPITYTVNGTQYVAVFAGANTQGAGSPAGSFLWAFKLGGTVPPAAPLSIPTRIPSSATAVSGATANNTVTLGRDWNYTTNTPGTTEDLTGLTAMAPAKLTVPTGTTVTFVNPASNAQAHGATEYFDGTFAIPPLAPGTSRTVTFPDNGTFFYNDPGYPQNTGVIVVGTG